MGTGKVSDADAGVVNDDDNDVRGKATLMACTGAVSANWYT